MLTLGAAVRIEAMTGDHADAVLAIYQAGIDEGDATFETRTPDWAAFTAARLPAHRFVATTAGQVAGWVAASPVSGRCVYAGVIEHSVYVHPAARGQGAGRRLLDTLIASTEAAGIWTIQSGIFPENTASLALHQAAGFRVVGTRERIGRHHGRWRDVILIERRSPAVLSVPARVGRSSRALRPSRAALAVIAAATAHLAAGSAASTPMIMKASSAAVPMHPAAPARPAARYRVVLTATASSATTATSAKPGAMSAATGTGQVHARLVTSATAQHNPTTGPTASSRRAARRAGCARANSAAISSGSPNSAMAAAAASS